MQPILYLSFVIIPATILTEIIELKRNDLNKDRLKDIYTNICIGIFFMAMGLSFRGLVLVSLNSLHEFSFFKVTSTWYHWILIFLLLDLIHYCAHCLEHNVRVFWTIHSIHHSSEHYNYSTAIRGPLGTAIYVMVYSAPLCLMGFEPLNVMLVDQIILLYAFFLHTEKVKKLGVLEYFMSTPSHHRVHHGANDGYLDKNFGACLIIWDKLFGTFKSEDVKPVYGIRPSMNSANPVSIVTHEWSRLIHDLRSTNDFKNWFNFIFNKPNWTPNSAQAPTCADVNNSFF